MKTYLDLPKVRAAMNELKDQLQAAVRSDGGDLAAVAIAICAEWPKGRARHQRGRAVIWGDQSDDMAEFLAAVLTQPLDAPGADMDDTRPPGGPLQ